MTEYVACGLVYRRFILLRKVGVSILHTAVQCQVPGKLLNGELISSTGNTFNYNQTTKFRCNEGFRLSGSAVLTCTSLGKWDAPLPTCVEQRCSLPPKIPNAILISNNVTREKFAFYQCKPGFKQQSGDLVRPCNQNGRLLGRDVHCLRKGDHLNCENGSLPAATCPVISPVQQHTVSR